MSLRSSGLRLLGNESRHFQHQQRQQEAGQSRWPGCAQPSPMWCACKSSKPRIANSPKLRSRRPAMARFGADRSRGTASPFWRAVLSRSSPAANCRATATISRRAISRPRSTACSSHRSTRPTATRSRGRNSNTSSPGWIVSRRMPPSYTLPACRSCSPATTTSCRPIAIFIRKTPTPRMRCCSREARARFAHLLDQGWRDAIRSLNPDTPMYTYWSYLRNRWPRDAGLRLDHLLLSKEAAKRLVAAGRRSRGARRRKRQRSRAGLGRIARCRAGARGFVRTQW